MALRSTELMIGDWVWNTHNQQVEQVQEIGSGLVKLDHNDLYEYDEIDTIPLTPEILEANGWMYVDEDRMFYGKKLEGELPWITYASHGGKMVFRLRDFCHLKYVHELQHALRLCGIEKEIKIKLED